MMCSSILSIWTAIFLLLLSGNTLRSYTNGKKNFVIHRLYKLTDTHMAPVTQCAMKVSLAALVMSHTVAATIYSLVSYGEEQCLYSFCFHKK
jgi:uncharacterized protein YggT (Ycf19 family)